MLACRIGVYLYLGNISVRCFDHTQDLCATIMARVHRKQVRRYYCDVSTKLHPIHVRHHESNVEECKCSVNGCAGK